MILSPVLLIRHKTENMLKNLPSCVFNKLWFYFYISLKIIKSLLCRKKFIRLDFCERFENYSIFLSKTLNLFFNKKIFFINVIGKDNNLVSIGNKTTMGFEKIYSSKIKSKSNFFFYSCFDFKKKNYWLNYQTIKHYSFFTQYFFYMSDDNFESKNKIYTKFISGNKVKKKFYLKNSMKNSADFYLKVYKNYLSFSSIFYKESNENNAYLESIFPNKKGIWLNGINKNICCDNFSFVNCLKKKISFQSNFINETVVFSNVIHSSSLFKCSNEIIRNVFWEKVNLIESIVESTLNHSLIFVIDNPIKIEEKINKNYTSHILTRSYNFNDYESFFYFKDKKLCKKSGDFKWIEKIFFLNKIFSVNSLSSTNFNFYNFLNTNLTFFEISDKNQIIIKPLVISDKIKTFYQKKNLLDSKDFVDLEFKKIGCLFSGTGKTNRYYNW